MNATLLDARTCPKCGGRFMPTERRDGDWLYVIFRCGACAHSAVVTYSPLEVEALERAAARKLKEGADEKDKEPHF